MMAAATLQAVTTKKVYWKCSSLMLNSSAMSAAMVAAEVLFRLTMKVLWGWWDG